MKRCNSFKCVAVANFTAIFLACLWLVSLAFTLHVMHLPTLHDQIVWAEGISSGWMTSIGVALKTSTVDHEPHDQQPPARAAQAPPATDEAV